MKLTVKNFGPIREAKDIDIRSMTIFVGPSNTGKSYLAMLIYATVGILSGQNLAFEVFLALLEKETNWRDIVSGSEESGRKKIAAYFTEWSKQVSTLWQHEILRCFGEHGPSLAKEKKCSVKITNSDSNLDWEIDLTSPSKSTASHDLQVEIYKHMKNYYQKEKKLTEVELFEENLHDIMAFEFSHILQNKMLGKSSKNAYYLPAIRGGIMQLYNALLLGLIRGASPTRIRRKEYVLDGVLTDIMEALINIEQQKDTGISIEQQEFIRKPFWRKIHMKKRPLPRDECVRNLSEEIEKQILAGKIEITQSEAGYPNFYYCFDTDNKIRLPMMNTSSSVSELAPIVLFIRHYLNPGDLFIVEEPEAHLHPNAQRKIADILSQLTKEGIKVLITTHSDIILEQISNFVNAEKVGEQSITQLDENECSSFLFLKPDISSRAKTDKTTVEHIKFNPETGYVTSDHLKVASELYNETIEMLEKNDARSD